MGIRCVPVVETHFDNCACRSPTCSAGAEGFGFKHAMMTLDLRPPRRRGAGRRAWRRARSTCAVSTPRKRQQFGQPIDSFQGIQ